MELYVGMDVSLKETSICVVDDNGEIVSEGVVISEPAAIATYIRTTAPHAKRIGLETGPTTTWLWHELRALGLPVICIDARHAKAALSMQINKSDRNDAAGIARIMQCGWYKEVQVKRLSCHEIRAVLNSRAQLVKIKRDLENQIRGLLKNLGLVIGKAGRQCLPSPGRGAAWRAGSFVGGRSAPSGSPREGRPRDRRALSQAPGPGTERRGQQTFHDGSRHRADHRLGLPLGDRRAEPLPTFPECRRVHRADAAPPCFRRGRLDGADLQMRRCHGPNLSLRGGRRAAHPGAAMVRAQGLGSQVVETHRLQEGQDRRGTEAGGHPPSHVA